MYKDILIATDGSELAGRAVEHGLLLAEGLGANVTIFTVAEPLELEAIRAALSGGAEDPVSLYERQVAERIREQFAQITRRASSRVINPTFVQEVGISPAEGIVRAAKQLDCDLIVMASHGRRGAARLLLGSQTTEVLTLATIPVLVVR